MGRPLDLIMFAGASNWPLWVADRRGFFRDEDLEVRSSVTPNSLEMAKDLASGRAQIALTAFDNIVAYAEGQGAAVAGADQFRAFLGLDRGLLELIVRPEVKDLNDLRGRLIAVDSAKTGFALVLRELLSNRGFGEADIVLDPVGGGAQRLDALLGGTSRATLLNAPLTFIAEAGGCRTLVKAADDLPHYQGVVAAAHKDWMARSASVLAAFVQAMRRAMAWLGRPENRAEAVALLLAEMPRLGTTGADRAYRLLVKEGGLIPDLAIDVDGAVTVIDLRSRWTGRPMRGVEAYVSAAGA